MLLYVFALIPSAILDIRYGIIPNKALIPALIIEGIISPDLVMLLICIGLYLFFVVTQKYWERFIGGADIKLMISIFYLIQFQLFIVINLAAFFALVYAYVTKRKQVRFIPFIILGLIGLFICN